MIAIKKNENCQGWMKVYSFGKFVSEVQGRAKAMEVASKLAHEHGETHISRFGKIVKPSSSRT